MKFLAGVAVGIAIGAAGAVVYSVQTGQDLRELFAGVRKNLEDVDFEKVGQRVEAGVSEVEARVEEGVTRVREKAATVAGDGSEAAEPAGT
ncbi:MAG: hypothetical protein ACXWQ6_05280 [Candidatus Limnocylindrales bacterium]